MSKDIKIKKGLTINLVGEAEKVLSGAPRSRTFAIRPADFHLITPRMMVKEGAHIQAGQPIFHSKDDESIKFVSPVSGVLAKIERGARRAITRLVIEADPQDTFVDHGVLQPESASAEAIKTRLLESGCWPFIQQRPYAIIANSQVVPRDIFISGINTAPLANDLDFSLKGKEQQIQAAITALSKLTSGKVHVGVGANATSVFSGMKNLVLHKVYGPHPVGNVGTQ